MEEAVPAAKSPSRALTCLAVGALLAAAAFHLVAISSMGDMGQSDAAGNGMAAGFAALAEMMLWAALGAFVLIACKGARLPADLLWVAGVLAIGGAIACNLAMTLVERPGWLRMTPTLVPPLTALFAIWARAGSDFPLKIRRIVAYTLAVPALALLVPPFVQQQRWEAAAPEREAARLRQQAEYEREEAEAAEAYAAELRAKGPDNRVDDFLQYMSGEYEEEAVRKIGEVRSRQEDVVRLLGGETEFYALDRLHDFNVEPNEALCTAYRAALDRRLAQFVPSNPDFRGIPGGLEGQQDNYRWLIAHGCDLAPQVSRLARMVRSLPDFYFERDSEILEAIARGR